jgi:hypothetical protein
MHTSCQRAHAHVFFFEHPPLPLSTCIYHANAPICALMHARKRPYTHAHRPSYAHTSAHMSHITHCCHINVTQMHMPCQVQIEVIFPLATTSFKASIHAGFPIWCVLRFGPPTRPYVTHTTRTCHTYVTQAPAQAHMHSDTRPCIAQACAHASCAQTPRHTPRHPGTHYAPRYTHRHPCTHYAPRQERKVTPRAPPEPQRHKKTTPVRSRNHWEKRQNDKRTKKTACPVSCRAHGTRAKGATVDARTRSQA